MDAVVAFTADGGQVRDQGVEVGDVVDVRGRDKRHQRHPARIGHDVVFGPRLAAIGWVRSIVFPRASRAPTRCPPPTGEEGLMQATPDAGAFPLQQASPARAPRAGPVSRGNICHGNPPRSTNRMPVSAGTATGLRKQRLGTHPS